MFPADLLGFLPGFCLGQVVEIHGEVGFAADPPFMLLNQQAAHQAVDARFVGEDADDTLAPPDLINQGSPPVKLVN